MKGSTLAILIIVCGVLAWFSFKPQSGRSGSNLVENSQPFKSFDVNRVNRVTLTTGGKDMVLEKIEKTWRAKNDDLDYPVDFLKLKKFLLSIRDMKIIDKKTSTDKHDKKFGLDAASLPVTMKFFDGTTELKTIYLGKLKIGEPDMNSQFPMPKEYGHYLRYKDKSVFESKEKVKVDAKPTFWMKSDLVKVEKDKISNIEFNFPYKQYKIDKKITQIKKSTDPSVKPEEKIEWLATGDLPDVGRFKTKEIGTLLDRLKLINVAEPVGKKRKASLAKEFPYHLKVMNGKDLLYEIQLQEKEETWYVKSVSEPNEIYQMDNWRVEQIFAYTKNLFQLSGFMISRKKLKAVEYQSLGYKATPEGSDWKLTGSKPMPEFKKQKLKETSELLKKLDITDYHVKDLKKEKGPSTIFHLENGEKIAVQGVGSVFLQDAKLITISGLKQVYSVSEHTYKKLFPEQKDLLTLKMKPEGSKGLTALTIPGATFTKKAGKWSMTGSKDHVKTEALTAFVDSLKVIYDSPYALTAKPFKAIKTVSLKAGKDELTLKFSDGNKGKALVSSSQFGGTFSVNWDVLKAMFKEPKHFLIPYSPSPLLPEKKSGEKDKPVVDLKKAAKDEKTN